MFAELIQRVAADPLLEFASSNHFRFLDDRFSSKVARGPPDLGARRPSLKNVRFERSGDNRSSTANIDVYAERIERGQSINRLRQACVRCGD